MDCMSVVLIRNAKLRRNAEEQKSHVDKSERDVILTSRKSEENSKSACSQGAR